MRIGVLALACLLAGTGVARAQHEGHGHDGEHEGTFEEALAHRSGPDLSQWMERHRWSLGDRIGEHLSDLLAARRAGDRTAVERHEIGAAFLAEMIATDPFSAWAVDVLMWDTEAGAHQETAFEAIRALPSIVAAGEGDSAWAQIEEIRKNVVPQGGWPFLGPDLARCAAAYLHAGDRERAKKLATELAISAEGLRQGVVLAVCERVLGEIARLESRVADATKRTARAFEIGAGLDSGPVASLLESIESLRACDIDTLVELAVGDSETLFVVVGEKGRAARRISLGRDAWTERARKITDPATARELYETLFGPEASRLGKTVGIVADGALTDFPFEALDFPGDDPALVRLTRPPLGGPAAASEASPAKRRWLVVLDERATTPSLGGDEVRIVKSASLDEIRKAAAGCTHLFVDTERFSAEAVRGWKLEATLAVLARSREIGLADALHAAGVRDVLVCLRTPGDEERRALADLCGRLARGERLPEVLGALGAARTSWILRRRS